VFVSAVGPTIQSASSTAAQIVYAKSINPGTDNIGIQFANSGSATSVSCVAVEYSGADTMYSLDSVSAGYSTRRVAHPLEVRIQITYRMRGAPLFRVLCERVGGEDVRGARV